MSVIHESAEYDDEFDLLVDSDVPDVLPESLEVQIENLEREITFLQDEMESYASYVTNICRKMRDIIYIGRGDTMTFEHEGKLFLKSEIKDFRDEKEALEAEVAYLKGIITERERTITSLEDQICSLEEEIDCLYDRKEY